MFKGWLASAVVHADRVEFRRRWVARLGGNRSGSVLLDEVLKIHRVEPTRLVNGHVHLMTAADGGAARVLAPALDQTPAGNPRTIMFTWGQRETYAAFVATAEEAWRARKPQL